MFRPFGDKPIRELAGNDAARLVDVAEGWFVEYKREPCKPKDYAKAVSAFANDRGGYLIVGIIQDAETRKPSQAPGIATVDAAALLDSARDAISQNLSPCPRFDMTFVSGPVESLGLAEGRALLVFEIPQSENTPHVHSSGRIFRRQADRSTPMEITNRAELDELYRRHSRLLKGINEALTRGFDDEWGTAFDVPWVHVALVPSVSNQSKREAIRFEAFRSATSSKAAGVSLPDAYPSSLGYVARNHSEQSTKTGPAVTFEYAHDGCVYLSIPLSGSSIQGREPPPFIGPEKVEAFLRVLSLRGVKDASLVDGTALVAAIVGLGTRMQAVLQSAQMAGPYLVRAHCMNLFRRIPYFASDTYIDWCRISGAPLIHRRGFHFPSRRSWDRIDEIQDELAIAAAAGMLLNGLGVPVEIIPAVVAETINACSHKA